MNSVLKWTAILLGTSIIMVGLIDRLYGYRYEDLFRVPDPNSFVWEKIPSAIDLEFQLYDTDHV